MKRYFTITKSLPEYGVTNYKELWQKAQGDGFEALQVPISTVFTKANGEAKENRFSFVFSSEKEDRHGDIVRQDFDLKHYKKNPVFLDSHNYWSIEAIIGRVEHIGVKDGMLKGEVVYAMENPRGVLARDLTDGGFLNATSIGFIPKEFSDKGEILKSELLEISAVSVPAQAEATIERTVAKSEPEAVTEPEEELQADPALSPRQKYLNALSGIEERHKRTLKGIAKAVSDIDMASPNRFQQKRKAFQAIRSLISTDT